MSQTASGLASAISETESRQMHRSVKRRLGVECLAIAAVMATFGFYFFKFPTPIMQAGSVLVMIGSALVAYQLWKKSTLPNIPQDTTGYSWADHQRQLWVQQRDALKTAWKWYVLPLVPGVAVFRWGVETEMLGQADSPFMKGPLANGLIAAIFIGVVLINLYSAHKLQKRIDELDTSMKA